MKNRRLFVTMLFIAAMAVSIVAFSEKSEAAICVHKWNAATCTSPKTCSKCGAKSGNSLGHSYAAATCTSPAKCTRCSRTTGTPLGHNWTAATCTSASKCTKCGSTSGNALGHSYSAATCTSPKKCSRCGGTSGSALGHNMIAANCSNPKKCSRCSYYEGQPLGHNWKAATCTAAKTCSRCGTTTGNSLGHSWAAATCTAPKTCSRCGSTTGTSLGHSWADATCTNPRTCKRCGGTSGSALGHKYSDATCTTPATCSRCSATSGSKLGHSYSSQWFVETPANCSTTGKKYCQCIRCSSKKYETIPKNDVHDIIPATCTSPKHCSRCSYSDTSTILGHKYGDWVTTKAATCENTGTKKRTCTRSGCSSSETATIPALGHSYSSQWFVETPANCSTTGKKYCQCIRCSAKKYETIPKNDVHDIIPATCTSPKHCSRCSYSDTSTILGHKYGDWVTTKEATCNADGTKKRTCTRSGCTVSETATIPALGHSYSSQWFVETPANCSTTGKKYCQCIRCSAKKYETIPKNDVHDIIPATCTSPKHCSRCSYSDTSTILGHKYGDWVTTKAATCDTDGTKKRTCTRSGCTVSETAAIPAPGHSYSSQWLVETPANCTTTGLKYCLCTKCDAKKYETIPKNNVHDIIPASCKAPEHCGREGCPYYFGTPIPHNIVGTTCVNPGACTMCGKEGKIDPNKHIIVPATCNEPEHCSREGCHYTFGTPTGIHTEVFDSTTAYPCVTVDRYICSVCKIQTRVEVTAATGKHLFTDDRCEYCGLSQAAAIKGCEETGGHMFMSGNACYRCGLDQSTAKAECSAAGGHNFIYIKSASGYACSHCNTKRCSEYGHELIGDCTIEIRCLYCSHKPRVETSHKLEPATCMRPEHCANPGCQYTRNVKVNHLACETKEDLDKNKIAYECIYCHEMIEGIATVEHDMKNASCRYPGICTRCGYTEGHPTDHHYIPATCVTPKKCVNCGEFYGTIDANNHLWIEATCTEPRKCIRDGCNMVDSTRPPRGHNWENGECTRCHIADPNAKSTSATHAFGNTSSCDAICKTCNRKLAHHSYDELKDATSGIFNSNKEFASATSYEQIINGLSHDIRREVRSDGTNYSKVCTKCGYDFIKQGEELVHDALVDFKNSTWKSYSDQEKINATINLFAAVCNDTEVDDMPMLVFYSEAPKDGWTTFGFSINRKEWESVKCEPTELTSSVTMDADGICLPAVYAVKSGDSVTYYGIDSDKTYQTKQGQIWINMDTDNWRTSGAALANTITHELRHRKQDLLKVAGDANEEDRCEYYWYYKKSSEYYTQGGDDTEWSIPYFKNLIEEEARAAGQKSEDYVNSLVP